jgi:hypothetical protein
MLPAFSSYCTSTHSRGAAGLAACAHGNAVWQQAGAPVELTALARAQSAENGQLGGGQHAQQALLEIGRVKRRQESERAHREGRNWRQRLILCEQRRQMQHCTIATQCHAKVHLCVEQLLLFNVSTSHLLLTNAVEIEKVD